MLNYLRFKPILLLLLCVATCYAQNGSTSAIDDYVRAEMTKQKIPGFALAIVKNGQIVLARGYGLSNVEHQVPVKPETIFQSGSVGKQFTATAVMMLVEEGKVGLDEKISKYLGEVPKTWKEMTVRHLLTHTSGLTDYPEDFDFRRDYTEDELLKRAQAIQPAFKPGEKWQYSNIAYLTLGILIHKVTGQFYGDFLQDRVFKPVGMTSTRIINEADIIPNRAAGYRIEKDQLKNQNWVSPTLNTTADGALYFNILDMAKWDAALYGETLLKQTSLQQMWTPVRLNNNKTYPYGFGWGVAAINGHRLIEHGGAWQGFTTYIGRYIDDKVTVIALDNLAGANPGKIARHVAAIYNSDLARRAIPDTESKVTALVKDLLQQFREGTADENLFTREARTDVFPARAQRIARLLNVLGTVNKIELTERTKEGERTYGYQLTFQNGTRFFRITLTADDKIADLVFIDDF